jgi:AraC-like DNA-binding protein/CheY-like chemotaxis protein
MYPKSIMWADLRFKRKIPSKCHLLKSNWTVRETDTPDCITHMATGLLPSVLVFEFDRPDIACLRSLSGIRQRFAAIPVLMLTEYHSEALAVWALRNRIMDYLVMPVSRDALLGSVEEAMSINLEETPTATCPQPLNPIPNELRFHTVSGYKTAAATDYVESHYHEAVREERVAELCNMSVSSFSRTFRQEHEKTFREYLLDYRIGKASELLRTPGVNVTDVAFTVGFNDVSHFSRTFKRVVGQTPSGFQQA